MRDDPGNRERILASIRQASKAWQAAPPPVRWPATASFTAADFRRNLEANQATTATTDNLAGVPRLVADYCQREELARNIAVAAGPLADLDWERHDLRIQRQWEESLSLAVTGCQAAVAETGQFLVTQEGGEAWLSLVAPAHVVVIDMARLHNSLDGLKEMLGAKPPPVATFVLGPSRTADIEQTLILGAHGPRKVHAILLAEKKGAKP